MFFDILLAIVIFSLGVCLLSRRHYKGPPSPGIALPIVGHLYMLKPNPMNQINEWSKRLGDVFALQMGSQRMIMLNGYTAIHDALVKHHECFLGRSDSFLHREMFDNKGIMSLQGAEWKEQRGFLKSVLRSLGMGNNVMVERIKNEFEVLSKIIAESNGEPTNFAHAIESCICNVICGITIGMSFEYNDREFIELMEIMHQLFENLGSSNLIQFFPILKYLPGDPFKHNELLDLFARMRIKLKKWIHASSQNINVTGESFENVVQAYVTEIERKNLAGVKKTTIDHDNLLSTLWGFFNAGTETTSVTIQCACLYMINFPEMQDRMYQEIKENVGTDRLPDLNDKAKLKYLNAFIMETQRYTSLVPMTVERMATKDLKLQGYDIHKGDCILIVLDSLLWDETKWGDPHTYRPERFLENGEIKGVKEFQPFLLGRRNCIGEALANAELFLVLAGLIQRFELLPEHSEQKPPIEFTFGFTRVPKPFKLLAIPRSNN